MLIIVLSLKFMTGLNCWKNSSPRIASYGELKTNAGKDIVTAVEAVVIVNGTEATEDNWVEEKDPSPSRMDTGMDSFCTLNFRFVTTFSLISIKVPEQPVSRSTSTG